jgi:hypothetical protein
MYPTGRFLDDPTTSTNGRVNHRPWWTDYDRYIDPVLDVVADWMASEPGITSFATWEVGSPVDRATFTSTANVAPNGEPIASSNMGVRPRYFSGGRAALTATDLQKTNTYPMGENMVGFLQYVYNGCDARGIIMREQIYWNRQDNPAAPNQFKHDRLNAPGNLDTVIAWHDWTPGSRLPDL